MSLTLGDACNDSVGATVSAVMLVTVSATPTCLWNYRRQFQRVVSIYLRKHMGFEFVRNIMLKWTSPLVSRSIRSIATAVDPSYLVTLDQEKLKIKPSTRMCDDRARDSAALAEQRT